MHALREQRLAGRSAVGGCPTKTPPLSRDASPQVDAAVATGALLAVPLQIPPPHPACPYCTSRRASQAPSECPAESRWADLRAHCAPPVWDLSGSAREAAGSPAIAAVFSSIPMRRPSSELPIQRCRTLRRRELAALTCSASVECSALPRRLARCRVAQNLLVMSFDAIPQDGRLKRKISHQLPQLRVLDFQVFHPVIAPRISLETRSAPTIVAGEGDPDLSACLRNRPALSRKGLDLRKLGGLIVPAEPSHSSQSAFHPPVDRSAPSRRVQLLTSRGFCCAYFRLQLISRAIAMSTTVLSLG